jgi:hypothetical protein
MCLSASVLLTAYLSQQKLLGRKVIEKKEAYILWPTISPQLFQFLI